jgi:hypothetical protein
MRASELNENSGACVTSCSFSNRRLRKGASMAKVNSEKTMVRRLNSTFKPA